MKNVVTLIAVCMISIVQGCATAVVRSSERAVRYSGYYPATRADVRTLSGMFDEPEVGNWMQGLDKWLAPLLVLDIPISLITDTVLLPLDVYEEAKAPENLRQDPAGDAVPLRDHRAPRGGR